MTEMYNPPKPEDLVDALQDPIHVDIGNSRPAYTTRMLKTKYKVDQTVWFLSDNAICSRTITTIVIVKNAHDDWASTQEQKEIFTPCGLSRIEYYIHGELFKEEDIFASKEELVKHLLGKP